MKRIHAIALTATSAAILSLSSGAAVAQTVSGGDPYEQGYSAGASQSNRTTLVRSTAAIGLAMWPKATSRASLPALRHTKRNMRRVLLNVCPLS
jgi:hypothetical protein